MPRPQHLFVLLVLSLPLLSSGLQFYLRAGSTQRRCFYDSAPPGTRILGEYTVAAGAGAAMPVSLEVALGDKDRRRLFFKDNIGHGKFAFVIPADATTAPHVEDAEFKYRKRANAGGGGAGARKLLAVEDAHGYHRHDYGGHEEHHDTRHDGHGEYHDDQDDHDWDMEAYEGLHEDELRREEAEAGRLLGERHATHVKLHAHDAQGHVLDHDAYDDELMEDEDVNEVFEERWFTICVAARDGPGTSTRRVRLVIKKGESAQDLHQLAKKEHMSVLEMSLRSMAAELHDLSKQLERAHRMEDALRSINQRTNTSVITFSSISIIAVLVIAGLQARYTKVYFKQKKIA